MAAAWWRHIASGGSPAQHIAISCHSCGTFPLQVNRSARLAQLTSCGCSLPTLGFRLLSGTSYVQYTQRLKIIQASCLLGLIFIISLKTDSQTTAVDLVAFPTSASSSAEEQPRAVPSPTVSVGKNAPATTASNLQLSEPHLLQRNLRQNKVFSYILFL